MHRLSVIFVNFLFVSLCVNRFSYEEMGYWTYYVDVDDVTL